MTIETEWLSYDVIVVGSGGAGAQAASAAAELGASVLLVSKYLQKFSGYEKKTSIFFCLNIFEGIYIWN